MKISASSLPLVVATVLGFVPVAGAGFATAATPASCPAVMEFSTGGAGQPNGIRLGAMGKPLPKGTQRTNVKYSASIAPVGGSASGKASTAEGERNLERAVRDFRKRCPRSHIRLVGFSQGALVTGNVCNTLDSDPKMNRKISCVLYSDPRRPDPIRPGVMGALASFVPGFPMMGQRPPTRNIKVTQVCQTNDGICAAPNPFVDPLGFINNLLGYKRYGAHGDYFAAPWVVDHGAQVIVKRDPYIPTADRERGIPGAPTLYDVFDPLTRLFVAEAPLTMTYRPTPLGAHLPPILAWLMPERMSAVILPPINDGRALVDSLVKLAGIIAETAKDLLSSAENPKLVPSTIKPDGSRELGASDDDPVMMECFPWAPKAKPIAATKLVARADPSESADPGRSVSSARSVNVVTVLDLTETVEPVDWVVYRGLKLT